MNRDVIDWRESASCAKVDPELFFPVGDSEKALHQTQRAKKVCLSCSVRIACLKWATQVGIDHGVWGGVDEQERRSIKRRAQRLAHRAA